MICIAVTCPDPTDNSGIQPSADVRTDFGKSKANKRRTTAPILHLSFLPRSADRCRLVPIRSRGASRVILKSVDLSGLKWWAVLGLNQ
jgi:hypothetical protein